jgi:hypothetical protein
MSHIKPCDWINCESPALKHVEFSGRIFSAVKASAGTDGQHHCDLCEIHIQLAHLQYKNVVEYELGSCPLTCAATI